ncbi:hypothetical protein [Frankia sp. Cj3]|nr:hypothetical protein [Frankia sp. Cj3]
MTVMVSPGWTAVVLPSNRWIAATPGSAVVVAVPWSVHRIVAS